MLAVPGAGSAATPSALPTLRSPTFAGANVRGPAAVSGPIKAPGGPYLYDRQGRVVFFHGVDAVYKYPPYELYPDPKKPWNFSTADASLMARLGFNVVRLGMTWSGLEPGTAPANDPAICGRGAPTNPHQFNQAHFDRYVNRLRQTVDLLGRFHIYTILDMHQDVYNEMFDGEGAPKWAVCTDGVPSVDPPGRWSLEYATKAAGIAFHHFWDNDVRGDLQGEYDRVWGDVARAFQGNRWVLGYDPFNEPFSTSLIRSETRTSTPSSSAFTPARPVSAALRTEHHPCGARGTIPPRASSRPSWQRPLPPDLRRAGQLREPRLPDLPGPDGPSQPRVQRPHLLRRPEPGDRQPHQRGGLRLPGCAFAGQAGRGPAADGLGRPARRTGLVRHRVRRHQQHGAPHDRHG